MKKYTLIKCQSRDIASDFPGLQGQSKNNLTRNKMANGKCFAAEEVIYTNHGLMAWSFSFSWYSESWESKSQIETTLLDGNFTAKIAGEKTDANISSIKSNSKSANYVPLLVKTRKQLRINNKVTVQKTVKNQFTDLIWTKQEFSITESFIMSRKTAWCAET